jgi:single-strand DNA-binding protein
MDFNKCILMGRLTGDPETRYTPNGVACTNFSIAINRKYKQGEDTKEEVSFFEVVTFGKQAENCGKYINKGDSVLIDGRLQQRRWDDKDTGQKRNKIEVVAQSVNFMPKRSKGQESSEPVNYGEAPPVEDNEDVPF